LTAALISDRCVNACGKFPSVSPVAVPLRWLEDAAPWIDFDKELGQLDSEGLIRYFSPLADGMSALIVRMNARSIGVKL